MEHCWVLKRHLEELVQQRYLDEFILPEEDPEIGETSTKIVD